MVEHMNSALFPIEKSTIREFTRLARETPGCIFLTIGEPDFPTNAPIKDAAKAALDADKTHYPEGNGEPYLRRAIADFEAQGDPLMGALAGLCARHGGLWNLEAEEYLLANAKSIEAR